MKVLIIGGTGFIGRAVARQCADRGDEVVLFNRGTSDPGSPHRTLVGDVARLRSHADELHAERADVVVHCIAYTERDAETFINVFAGLDCRSVVLGSQDCYAAFHAFKTERETSDWPIDEDAPLADRHYWGERHPSHDANDLYDKNLMTDVLMRAGSAGDIESTVLRLPMVWGPGDPQFEHRHGDIIWHLLDGRQRMVFGASEQGTIWTFGYIENVAAAIMHAISHPAAANAVFNVGETAVRTKRRWADLYASTANVELAYSVVPDHLLDDDTTTDRPTFHIITDNTRFGRVTGFKEPVALDDAIARTYAWALDNRDKLGKRPEYVARDAAAERAAQGLGGTP